MTNIKIHIRGSLSEYISAKDVAIHILGILGTESARDKTIEFAGPGIAAISVDDKAVISDAIVNIGASSVVFPKEETSKKRSKVKSAPENESELSDIDVTYEAIYDIDLSDIVPTVSSASVSHKISEISHGFDSVIIGGLNGKLNDIKAAYDIIKDRHVAKDIDAILIPETAEVYKDAIKKGYIEEFIDAGFRIFPPGYTPENNGSENCLSTMSHFDDAGFTASPQVVAASALMGKISDPRIVDSKAERKAEKKTEKQLEKAERLAEKAEKAAEKARKSKAAK